MQTLFRISCLGWQEWTPEGYVAGTIYFEYRIALKHHARSFPLLFGYEPVSEFIEFPVGNPEYDLLNDLIITVIDTLGDTSYTKVDVKVKF